MHPADRMSTRYRLARAFLEAYAQYPCTLNERASDQEAYSDYTIRGLETRADQGFRSDPAGL